MMQNGNPILCCKRLSVGKLSTHTTGHSGCMYTVCPAVSTTVRVLLSPDNEVACPESSHIPQLGFSGGDQEKDEVISFSSRYSPRQQGMYVAEAIGRERYCHLPSLASLAFRQLSAPKEEGCRKPCSAWSFSEALCARLAMQFCTSA